MPAHWYVTSALPRGLLAALPLSVSGVAQEPRLRPLAASISAFVALYSCLGHKEVRNLVRCDQFWRELRVVALRGVIRYACQPLDMSRDVFRG